MSYKDFHVKNGIIVDAGNQISVGNSTVNATINSTAVSVGGVAIGGGYAGSRGYTGSSGDGPNWRGEWAPSTFYYFMDYVSYQNSNYICIQDLYNINPTNASYWELSLQGLTGYTGSIGNIGPTGYAGSRGYSGSLGFTGSQGTTGFTGSASTVIGYTGSASTVIGYTGSASTVIGYTGSRGYAGSVPSSIDGGTF